MLILDKFFLTLSLLIFTITFTYFISYTITILIYLLKFILYLNHYIDLIKNILYFIPLIIINILCIFIFLIIFLIFIEFEYLKILEIYYYFRYICHPKTISTMLYYLPIKDNIKFFPMIISFILIANIYEFLNTYKILEYKYKYVNQQFHTSNKHVRYQILSSLMLLRISDIMSNHQILITDASHIIDMFRENSLIFNIIERYEIMSSNLLETNNIDPKNYDIFFTSLGIIELINIIIYILLVRLIKRKFI
ncbi:hypothetical protein IOLA_181 [uncultured bacterium]|nr:hypothetical protein IOLA_181 [uncultured bacterium]